METRFTRVVGCRVPIQQAPMGSISSASLTAAVAAAGAVGSFATLGMPADVVARRLDALDVPEGGAVAVNFLTADLDRDALAAAAARARIVDFFWSSPDAGLVALAHEGGALVSWQVGSADEAAAAVDAGCDIVVAQGTEAGGHVWGDSPLLPLLDAVLDRVDVPVLAAGGISTARSFAAVLAAGADGARIGTRFIATTESGAHPAYVDAVIAAAGPSDTEISDAFGDCPLCAIRPTARSLRSAISAVRAFEGDLVGEVPLGRSSFPVTRGSGMPPSIGATGHVDAMAMYAGAGVGGIHETKPAAAVIAELVDGAAALLAGAAGR